MQFSKKPYENLGIKFFPLILVKARLLESAQQRIFVKKMFIMLIFLQSSVLSYGI